MATRQDVSEKAGEIVGQAQVKRDEFMSQTVDAAHDAKDKASTHDQSTQPASTDLKDQAANFLQQTGEQVKNMAQGAAEAVKNTLGMNTDNSTNTSHNANSPSKNNPSTRI